MTYTLPHFPEFNLSQLSEYYSVEIEHQGQEVSIDVNFAGTEIAAEVLDQIAVMIENVSAVDEQNRAFIAADYEQEAGGTVKEFIDFHVEELAEELSGIVNFEDETNSPGKQLLEKLKLGRIGFYPDGKYGAPSFVMFDYYVDRELSDQIIVVNLNPEGKLLGLAWES